MTAPRRGQMKGVQDFIRFSHHFVCNLSLHFSGGFRFASTPATLPALRADPTSSNLNSDSKPA